MAISALATVFGPFPMYGSALIPHPASSPTIPRGAPIRAAASSSRDAHAETSQGHRHGTSGHGTQQSTTDMALPPPELGPPGRIHFTCRQPNPPPSPIHVVPRVEEEVVVRSAGGPPWTVATKNSSGEKEPNQIAPATLTLGQRRGRQAHGTTGRRKRRRWARRWQRPRA